MTRKTNKILAATAMLLVSVIMLGTATYAWFAMNTRSVANGLTVEAYSDSNFLEISQTNVDADYGINTTFTQNNTGLLRLVTSKRFNATEVVKITANPVASGTTYSEGDTNAYYKAVDGDIPKTDLTSGNTVGFQKNYIYVPMTDKDLPSDTSEYYIDPVFTLVKTETNGVDGTVYFERINNTYKKVSNTTGVSVKGYYTATLTKDNGGHYEEGHVYYSFDGVYLTRVDNLHTGTDLSQYYTLQVEDYDASTHTTSIEYYLKNEVMGKDDQDQEVVLYTDYSYIGKNPIDVAENYIYWGRAYSNDPTKVQANNTLTIINGAKSGEYYLQKTLYLRQAEGTNLATNLRVEEIRIGGATNALHGALRVLLVATSSSDPTNIVTSLYDAGKGTFDNQLLFSKLLGNMEETITVQVYIYFDGTDEIASNTTLVGANLNGQSVEIEFAIDELSYN